MDTSEGKLWVIATPIGNLGDISPRARNILETLDLLACENLNSARRLCSALQVRCPRLVLYREDSCEKSTQRILSELKEGNQCGLISDAGSPGLSDPGWRLVAACHQERVPVVSVAGPSALTAALAAAGQPTRRFLFEGFPPHKKCDRRAFFEKASETQVTSIFFESPHNILDTLQLLREFCGPQRKLSISRELSKLHETNLQASLDYWLDNPPPARGEFVLVLEPAPPRTNQEAEKEEQLIRQSEYLSQCQLSAAQVRDFLVMFCGASRNQAYRIALIPPRPEVGRVE
ncbi:16S rRNA (cytidine(1402)-2'-O)-methyltransferase [bacterium]|nr:16S rRNA (cytidine(1402)-2'-O)-methyltransferase [bacterium]